MVNNNLTHTHVHTYYSFLDGLSSPEVLVKRAKELGMTSLAITDHNHLGGAYDFKEACKKHDIKPLLGCEMYYTDDTSTLALSADERFEKAKEKAINNGIEIPAKATKKAIKELIADYTYDTKQYHILFLAMNQNGWKNLVKLQSEAARKCTYNGRYLCDLDMIRKYSDDLIMTTACLGSKISHLINDNKEQEALNLVLEFKEIFEDRLYLEIQPLDSDEQVNTNLAYMKWSELYNIPLVATTDVHYAYKEDNEAHDTLLCIGTGKKKSDTERMKYSHDFWLRDYNEMTIAFERQLSFIGEDFADEYMNCCKKALDNTNLIADRITNDIKLGSDTPLFPDLGLDGKLTAEEYLTKLCYNNLYKYKNKKTNIDLPTYEKRLAEELKIINNKGFAPYMLTVYEYVNWCDENNIPVGPGRGSAAGSLALFTLGITKIIDPIEYNLLFFRFLTEDRTAPPDVDLDFSFFQRDRVIEHLEDKYGKEKVCHIGTYTTMGVKSGLKDVGRVLDIDYKTMDAISKAIDVITDEAPSIKFKNLDELKEFDNETDQKKYNAFKDLEETYPLLFELARKFEGTPRNMGVHASGVLVTPFPISDLIPTRVDKDGVTIALYTGPQLEYLNFIKLDVLGLKTLDVLDITAKSIDKNSNLEDWYDKIDIKDEKVYKLLKAKLTEGIFQMESNLFKGLIDDIKPDDINDIIALTSIARPGPLNAGMHKLYANRKHGNEEAMEPLPNTWDLVQDTYGTIIYQEAIMLIAQRVAKFNGNQSDSYLRKATAKKKKDLLDLCRQWFIYGKLNEEAPEGYDEENKNQVMYDPTGKYGDPILGGINNGGLYTVEMLSTFWESIQEFCSYLFNKSHAACYSYVTVLTAYFKAYYPANFMAAILSMQKDFKKMPMYIEAIKSLGIAINSPDINKSKIFHSVDNSAILYGIGTIKGIGEAKLETLISNAPYENLEDAFNRLPKKIFNKAIGTSLIKAGAFDFENPNRLEMLNLFYDLRKDKDDRYDPDCYNRDMCMTFEKECLGSSITYTALWETFQEEDKVQVDYTIETVTEKVDKNGRLMGFLQGMIDGQTVKAVMFSKQFVKNLNILKEGATIVLKGSKDKNGSLVVSSVLANLI